MQGKIQWKDRLHKDGVCRIKRTRSCKGMAAFYFMEMLVLQRFFLILYETGSGGKY